MASIGESYLSELVHKSVSLKLIEPQIYSVFQSTEVANPYDTQFGYIYDWVA
jgi:hypothetical protein